MAAAIPDKIFFKIGEVAKIVCLRPSVLRYWETEFEALNPGKSPTGQRLYRKKELELIFEIKKLLYTEKLTIEGARKRINNKRQRGEMTAPEEVPLRAIRDIVHEVKEDLIKIQSSLQKSVA